MIDSTIQKKEMFEIRTQFTDSYHIINGSHSIHKKAYANFSSQMQIKMGLSMFRISRVGSLTQTQMLARVVNPYPLVLQQFVVLPSASASPELRTFVASCSNFQWQPSRHFSNHLLFQLSQWMMVNHRQRSAKMCKAYQSRTRGMPVYGLDVFERLFARSLTSSDSWPENRREQGLYE